jgi:hypothetical protein
MTLLSRSGACCLQHLLRVQCFLTLEEFQLHPLPSMTSARVSNIATLTTTLCRTIACHSWHRHFLTNAWSYNVNNILNLKYAPMAFDERRSLTKIIYLNNLFLFSAFLSKRFLLLMVLSSFVFIPILEMQLQSILAQSNATAAKSTAAQLSASEIKQCLRPIYLVCLNNT